jgi:hypothetical protein
MGLLVEMRNAYKSMKGTDHLWETGVVRTILKWI